MEAGIRMQKNYQVNRAWFFNLKERQNNSDGLISHRLRTFTRLEAYPEMLLFSVLKDSPEWAIRSALLHFANRFPTFVIAFHCNGALYTRTFRKDARLPERKGFSSPEEGLSWLRVVLAGQFDERFEADAELAEEHYEKFYNSQFIPDRRNLGLQRSRMREAGGIQEGSIEWKAMRRERFVKPNTTLKEFC
ncbi:Uncharacterised protein [uncultured archaeon]|nr:Uncharacterised protein [uncultured archaeon]